MIKIENLKTVPMIYNWTEIIHLVNMVILRVYLMLEHFYNKSTNKVIVAFGTIFNNIKLRQKIQMDLL